MTSFKTTPLYGGAITCDLPSNFRDASILTLTSTIREVPDNQEVYLDADGYASIVFDILEHVHRPTHEEALQFHFQDLVDGTGDSTNVLRQGVATMERMPDKTVHTLSFLQTPAPNPHPNPSRKEPEFVAIHLILLRLKEQDTDIVITINEPHYPNEYEKAAKADEKTKLMEEGEQIAKRILESFEVREWGLFEGA